ncbi:hypothetical protein ILUMI_07770 [Ignelater luminosus]|uniref:Nose resistant-to-fluoxetine protein N-terminal domain-containing protein n=1 Tax=Ignelater luminosus TaxID=2038154 RepID=A0A8K0DCS2_IGNLU|nr:hypothetical protein ILUMI_07770 [Ignelater luminosus]
MWFTKVLIALLCYTSCSYGNTNNFDVHLGVTNSPSVLQPQINSKSNISKTCQVHIRKYQIGIFKKETWALQMLDSSANLPSSGILNGNLIYLGDFDTCINIKHEAEISGKYCLGSLPLSSGASKDTSKFRNLQTPEARMVAPDGAVSGMFAVCLPDSCSAEDFQDYYKNKIMKLKFFENLCTSKSTNPELDAGDITTISIISVILYIMLMSTGYEVLTFYIKLKPAHPFLTAFSLITNTKKLLQTTSGSGQISCLHGIRVISMMWVIFGHRYAISSTMPIVNPASMLEWFLNKENMIVLGGTVSVDTFFLLGGLLVSYGFLVATSKGFKFNIFIYYFHRFLRLTPLLAILVLIHATVLKHLGTGPLWNYFITGLSRSCETYWWSTLLYIQNYVNPDGMCMKHTWYLSTDTQLFLLSPLILLPLKHWPKIGLALTGFLTLCSIITSFTVGWIDELYGFIAASVSNADYGRHYYIVPHTRAAPWLMGIILGYIIFDIKQKRSKISINTFINILLWLVSLAILLACVFTGQNTLEDTYVYDKFTNAVYIALLRPGWALGVSWVMFACITGHGGPINWFLSLPVFQVLSKLTYSMYLIHYTLLYILSAQTRISIYFSNLQMMYVFWGDFAFTLGAAVIFTLAFESPIIMIEKIIFGKKEKSPPLRDQVSEPEERQKRIEIP